MGDLSLAAQGQGQYTADFSGASKEAACYSEPWAAGDQRAAERTQRWAWTAGNHYRRNPSGMDVHDGGLGSR
eukprot:5938494-Amphidinium_carterae.1